MFLFNTTSHRKNQIKVIDKIEKQIKSNKFKASVVNHTDDYDNDPRRCLTSVYLPDQNLIQTIEESLIEPLRKISPDHYYYQPSSLHF